MKTRCAWLIAFVVALAPLEVRAECEFEDDHKCPDEEWYAGASFGFSGIFSGAESDAGGASLTITPFLGRSYGYFDIGMVLSVPIIASDGTQTRSTAAAVAFMDGGLELGFRLPLVSGQAIEPRVRVSHGLMIEESGRRTAATRIVGLLNYSHYGKWGGFVRAGMAYTQAYIHGVSAAEPKPWRYGIGLEVSLGLAFE